MKIMNTPNRGNLQTPIYLPLIAVVSLCCLLLSGCGSASLPTPSGPSSGKLAIEPMTAVNVSAKTGYLSGSLPHPHVDDELCVRASNVLRNDTELAFLSNSNPADMLHFHNGQR